MSGGGNIFSNKQDRKENAGMCMPVWGEGREKEGKNNVKKIRPDWTIRLVTPGTSHLPGLFYNENCFRSESVKLGQNRQIKPIKL